MNEVNVTSPSEQRERLEPVVMRHKLDIVDCTSDDYRCLMSKGHHPKASFLSECEAYMGEALSKHWCKPKYLWWRVVPAHKNSGFNHFFHEAVAGSKGAFPVTITDDL